MVTKTIKIKAFSLQSVGTRDCYFTLNVHTIINTYISFTHHQTQTDSRSITKCTCIRPQIILIGRPRVTQVRSHVLYNKEHRVSSEKTLSLYRENLLQRLTLSLSHKGTQVYHSISLAYIVLNDKLSGQRRSPLRRWNTIVVEKLTLCNQNVIGNVRLLNTWPPFREGGAGGILISRTSARDLVWCAVASFTVPPSLFLACNVSILQSDRWLSSVQQVIVINSWPEWNCHKNASSKMQNVRVPYEQCDENNIVQWYKCCNAAETGNSP